MSLVAPHPYRQSTLDQILNAPMDELINWKDRVLSYSDVILMYKDCKRKLEDQGRVLDHVEKQNEELIKKYHDLLLQHFSLNQENEDVKGKLTALEKKYTLMEENEKHLESHNNQLQELIMSKELDSFKKPARCGNCDKVKASCNKKISALNSKNAQASKHLEDEVSKAKFKIGDLFKYLLLFGGKASSAKCLSSNEVALLESCKNEMMLSDPFDVKSPPYGKDAPRFGLEEISTGIKSPLSCLSVDSGLCSYVSDDLKYQEASSPSVDYSDSLRKTKTPAVLTETKTVDRSVMTSPILFVSDNNSDSSVRMSETVEVQREISDSTITNILTEIRSFTMISPIPDSDDNAEPQTKPEPSRGISKIKTRRKLRKVSYLKCLLSMKNEMKRCNKFFFNQIKGLQNQIKNIHTAKEKPDQVPNQCTTDGLSPTVSIESGKEHQPSADAEKAPSNIKETSNDTPHSTEVQSIDNNIAIKSKSAVLNDSINCDINLNITVESKASSCTLSESNVTTELNTRTSSKSKNAAETNSRQKNVQRSKNKQLFGDMSETEDDTCDTWSIISEDSIVNNTRKSLQSKEDSSDTHTLTVYRKNSITHREQDRPENKKHQESLQSNNVTPNTCSVRRNSIIERTDDKSEYKKRQESLYNKYDAPNTRSINRKHSTTNWDKDKPGNIHYQESLKSQDDSPNTRSMRRTSITEKIYDKPSKLQSEENSPNYRLVNRKNSIINQDENKPRKSKQQESLQSKYSTPNTRSNKRNSITRITDDYEPVDNKNQRNFQRKYSTPNTRSNKRNSITETTDDDKPVNKNIEISPQSQQNTLSNKRNSITDRTSFEKLGNDKCQENFQNINRSPNARLHKRNSIIERTDDDRPVNNKHQEYFQSINSSPNTRSNKRNSSIERTDNDSYVNNEHQEYFQSINSSPKTRSNKKNSIIERTNDDKLRKNKHQETFQSKNGSPNTPSNKRNSITKRTVGDSPVSKKNQESPQSKNNAPNYWSMKRNSIKHRIDFDEPENEKCQERLQSKTDTTNTQSIRRNSITLRTDDKSGNEKRQESLQRKNSPPNTRSTRRNSIKHRIDYDTPENEKCQDSIQNEDYSLSSKRRRIEADHSPKQRDAMIDLPFIKPTLIRTTFKRPTCLSRKNVEKLVNKLPATFQPMKDKENHGINEIVQTPQSEIAPSQRSNKMRRTKSKLYEMKDLSTPEITTTPVTIETMEESTRLSESNLLPQCLDMNDISSKLIDISNPPCKTIKKNKTPKLFSANDTFKNIVNNYIKSDESLKTTTKGFQIFNPQIEKVGKILNDALTVNVTENSLDELIDRIGEFDLRIIAEALTNFLRDCVKYNGVPIHVPTLPPMPFIHQTSVCFLERWQFRHPPSDDDDDIYESVMKSIEFKCLSLNSKMQIGGLSLLTRFYATVCHLAKRGDRLKLFCFDALYTQNAKSIPIIQAAVDAWPFVFPRKEYYNGSDPLVITMIHLIFKRINRHYVDNVYNLSQKLLLNLTRLNYKDDYNDLDILQFLIERLKGKNHGESLKSAFLLMGKCCGVEWCYNILIMKNLMPIIVSESESMNSKVLACQLLGPLMRPFPTTMTILCENVITQLVSVAKHKANPDLEEAVFCSISYLHKKDHGRIAKELWDWNPMKNLEESTLDKIKRVVTAKNRFFWEKYTSRNRNAKTNQRRFNFY